MSLSQSLQKAYQQLFNPTHTKWLSPVLFLADALLCALIILKVPYTEIDWTTYMQQVQLFIDGERDYEFIKGSTGPLVYPGLHVYVYRALHYVTDEGRDVRRAQWVFMGVYLTALGVVMGVYRNARVPPYIFPMLVLSKRLHSIFVLRLFNDGFAVLFLFAAIWLYQKRQWTVGSAVFSCALGVKMSALLVLPTLGLILLMAMGRERFITQLMLIGQMQAYVSRAFQLNRVFLYKWTVNWRFVPEETFLSKPFAILLLAVQAGLLLVFAQTRWIKPTGRTFEDFLRLSIREHSGPYDQGDIYRRVTPDFIATAILTANAIGMLCARSLHYQFYAWTAWSTPFLLHKAKYPPAVAYAIWGAQEWAWNVYPSTKNSSWVVVLALVLQIRGVWLVTADEFRGVVPYDAPIVEDVGSNGKPVDASRITELGTHEHAE